MEQTFLEAISINTKDKRKTGNNQYTFTKSQLTNQYARPVDKGTAMDVYTLTKSLAFKMVCHHIP